LLYERKTLKVIVETITGHSSAETSSHSLLGIASDPDCRKCGMEEETAFIVCECPAIKSIRVRVYGKHSSYLKRSWRSHFGK